MLLLSETFAAGYPVYPYGPANHYSNTVTIPPGWSLIANPLNHNRGTTAFNAVPDNTVAELFKSVPYGTRLSKLDPFSQSFLDTRFTANGWSNPGQTLFPGEGAFIYNPTRKPFEVTFTGNCPRVYIFLLPGGFSLLSSPDCGAIDFAPSVPPPPPLIPSTDWDSLNFNAQEGDAVYTFNNTTKTFSRHSFRNGAWDRLPILHSGEACLIRISEARVIRFIGIGPL